MKKLIFLFYFLFATNVAYSQESQTKIAKLEFLVGKWSGPGVSYLNDGTEQVYHDTEDVRFDLDKNLLLINAKGEADGKKTYQLHTVIYYDPEVEHYWYTPYSGKRRAGVFSCKLIENIFRCINADDNFRLTFQRLDDGKWNEFGERLNDKQWKKTFETILSAQED